MLEGADAGDSIEEMMGDWGYEFSSPFPAEWEDTGQPHLMKGAVLERIGFSDWCRARG